ncbi:hypothetical protein SUNI508_14105, partial [Seiridium unicorne]
MQDLGRVLARLGERLGDRKLLLAAEANFQLALEERSREREPDDWAMTQQNLGSVLLLIGHREE